MEDSWLKSMKGIFKGAGVVVLGIFLSKIFGYIYRIIVARTGTEPYGLLSIGLAFFGVLVSLSLCGLHMGVLRYVSYYKNKQNPSKIKSTILTTLKISLFLSLILSFLSFVLSPWLANTFFHNPELVIIFRIISFSIPFDVLAIILFQVNKAFQIVKYEIVIKYIGENLIKIISLIFFLALGFKIIGPTLAYVIGVILTGIITFFITRKKVFNFLDKNLEYTPMYRKLFSFSWPLLFTSFLLMLISWTDTLMLGYFKTVSEVGIYNAAMPTAQILYIIPYAFSFLFIPILTKFYAKKKWTLLSHLYYSTTKWIFIINLLVLTTFIFTSKTIIQLLFGPNYFSSIIPLMILSTGCFIGYFPINSENILLIFKRTRLILFNMTVGAVFNFFLNLLLIPNYGVVGAAIATSSSLTVMALLYIIQANHITKIKLLDFSYLKSIFAISLAILCTHLISKLIHFNKLIFSWGAYFVLLSLFYLFFLFAFKILRKDDKQILNALKKSIIK
ncbi:MAG: flippase [Nanoarchaeota archaeon]|nr:flippase [Nanoarchaeota archaeon]